MKGEALNYLKELEVQRSREVNFSELSQRDKGTLYNFDDYEIAEKFTVMGMSVYVYDEWISEALKKLPVKKRDIILMLFFLDMTEQDVADFMSCHQTALTSCL